MLNLFKFKSMEKLTISELAQFLDCTVPTLHRYKKEGKIPFFQVGRTVFFDKAEVLKALRKEAKQ